MRKLIILTLLIPNIASAADLSEIFKHYKTERHETIDLNVNTDPRLDIYRERARGIANEEPSESARGNPWAEQAELLGRQNRMRQLEAEVDRYQWEKQFEVQK